jgi:hypothetical protein
VRLRTVCKESERTLRIRVRARTVHKEGVMGGTVCKGGVRLRTVRKGSVSKEYVRMNKSRMLACIVLQCGHHYISMFLTIYQPPDLTTEPATWHFNNLSYFYLQNLVFCTYYLFLLSYLLLSLFILPLIFASIFYTFNIL